MLALGPQALLPLLPDSHPTHQSAGCDQGGREAGVSLAPAVQRCRGVELPYERRDAGNFTWIVLGPYSSAMKSKLPILQKHGVTHIICIRQNIEANFIKPNFQQFI